MQDEYIIIIIPIFLLRKLRLMGSNIFPKVRELNKLCILDISIVQRQDFFWYSMKLLF